MELALVVYWVRPVPPLRTVAMGIATKNPLLAKKQTLVKVQLKVVLVTSTAAAVSIVTVVRVPAALLSESHVQNRPFAVLHLV